MAQIVCICQSANIPHHSNEFLLPKHKTYNKKSPRPKERHLIGGPLNLLTGLGGSLSISPSSRVYRLTICSRKVATLPIITCSIVLCPGVAIHCIIDDRKSSFK